MSNCIYCGKPAGFLKKKHAECEVKERRRLAEVNERLAKIEDGTLAVIDHPVEVEKFRLLIEDQSQSGKLTQEDIRSAIIKGWGRGVDRCLENGVVDSKEESALVFIINEFQFTEKELDQNGAHSKLVKALVIRDVIEGRLPLRMHFNESLPINLQKGEKVVWAFAGCEYFEDRIKRSIQGSSRGVSVKVMKGVYYRVGGFKGSPVYSTERVLVDRGVIYITNKHIYFSGPVKSLRVPYPKIVSFEPFDDGIGIMRDAQTAKLQVFKTGDGWFTYNLLTNLAQLGIQA